LFSAWHKHYGVLDITYYSEDETNTLVLRKSIDSAGGFLGS